MSNKYKAIAALLLIALALVIYMESGQKATVNWYPSYSKTDKIPRGTYVLYNTLKETRSDDQFTDVRQPPFEYLTDSSDQRGTYFFVNDYILFDEAESMRLLSWVDQGNTLFIAARGIGETILDTLGLDTDVHYVYNNFEHKPLLNLVNPSLEKSSPYYLDIETVTAHFNEVDTLQTKVLGEFGLMADNDTLKIKEPRVHFVKQSFGDGEIYIHLMPDVFTNYFMLRENNYEYTEDALSYVDQESKLYWDNHYKNGKTVYTSPLYVFLSNRYLKWAYYMVIIGTFLWVIFEGRRKQRAIRIIEPLPNQTLTFTKTIAGMYLDKRDHKSIVNHQVNHFLAFIRGTYNVNTAQLSDDFITRLSAKSGNTVEDTKLLINYLVTLRSKTVVTQDELMELNKRIEDFKN